MPQTLIIGRAGQPFFIAPRFEHVSREHAQLTIPDDPDHEPWLLEDLGSLHGTWIRSETGQMRRIEKAQITPLTFIMLGPGDYASYGFYACHALNPESYTREWNHLISEGHAYIRIKEEASKISTWKKWLNRAIWPMFILADLLLTQFSSQPQHASSMWFRYPLMALGWGATWWVTRDGRVEKAKRHWNNIRRCPNPDCAKDLTIDDVIRSHACPYCHCHV